MTAGEDRRPQWTVGVEWSKVREFARAVHDRSWEDEQGSVPPTFPMYVIAERVDRLLAVDLSVDPMRVLAAEQEFEYLRPLRVGDRLACRTRVVDEYVKEGRRGGRLRFFVFVTEMWDEASGHLIVRQRSTFVETAAKEAGDGSP